MTSRPPSHLIHSGLLDIVSLIPPSQARPSIQKPVQVDKDKRRSKPENDLRAILKDDAIRSPTPRKAEKKGNKGEDGKRNSVAVGVGVEVGLRKRKVDKGMIGPPTDFR